MKLISPAFASLPLLGALAAGADIAAIGDGAWRIRDLHLMRLFRGVADQLEWNVIAEGPRWMHTIHENSVANVALLFASAAVAMVVALLPVACVVAHFGRRIRDERWGNAAMLSVMAAAAIALTAGPLLLTLSIVIAVSLLARALAPEQLRRCLSWGAAASLVLIVSAAGESALFPSPQQLFRAAAAADAPSLRADDTMK